MQRLSRATRFATAVVALAALSTLSCGRGDRAGAGTAAGVVESSEPSWTTGEAWRIGPVITSVGALDGPPEGQLYQVMDLTRLEDGSVVVASRGSGGLRVYGPDGAFIRAMGGEGEGPGEFGIPRYVDFVPPDTLITVDSRLGRAVVYRSDGMHIRTVRVSRPIPYGVPRGRLDDGRWVLFTTVDPDGREGPIEGHHRAEIAAIAVGSDSISADTLATGPGPEGWNEVTERMVRYWYVPFGADYLAAASGDRVAISDGRAYDIVVVTLAGDTLHVRRAIDRQPVTAELVDAWTSYWADRWTGDRREGFLRTIDQIDPADFVPTHTELGFDRLGNLWVENYRHPWEVSPRVWSVFGRDGRWLGDVELPDGLQVYEIGDDYIAGIERDEIGVEYMRVYALEKPRQGDGAPTGTSSVAGVSAETSAGAFLNRPPGSISPAPDLTGGDRLPRGLTRPACPAAYHTSTIRICDSHKCGRLNPLTTRSSVRWQFDDSQKCHRGSNGKAASAVRGRRLFRLARRRIAARSRSRAR